MSRPICLIFFTIALSLDASAGVLEQAQVVLKQCMALLTQQQSSKVEGLDLPERPRSNLNGDTYSVRDLWLKDSSLFTVNAVRDVDRNSKISLGDDYEIFETFPQIDLKQALVTVAQLDQIKHTNDIGHIRVVRREGEWIPFYPMHDDDGSTRKYFYLRLPGKLPDIVRLRLELSYQKLVSEFQMTKGYYPANIAHILFGVDYDGSNSSEFHFDTVEPGVFVDTVFGRGTIGLSQNGLIFQSPEHSGLLFRGPNFLHAAERSPGLRVSTRMSVGLSPSNDRLLPIVDQIPPKSEAGTWTHD